MSDPIRLLHPRPIARLIDIFSPLANDKPADPPIQTPHIAYIDHQQSMPGLLGFFPGLKAEDLPDGEARVVEHVTLVSRHASREAEDRLRGIQGNAGACIDLCEELELELFVSTPDRVILQSIRPR